MDFNREEDVVHDIHYISIGEEDSSEDQLLCLPEILNGKKKYFIAPKEAFSNEYVWERDIILLHVWRLNHKQPYPSRKAQEIFHSLTLDDEKVLNYEKENKIYIHGILFFRVEGFNIIDNHYVISVNMPEAGSNYFNEIWSGLYPH